MSDTITLYHGTSTKHLKQIEARGILPRTDHDNSNWEELPSSPCLVYLSTAYPVYFAWAATHKDDDLMILRCEVPKDDLYPDEDFVAVCIQAAEREHGTLDKSLVEITKEVNPLVWKHLASKCLEHNGKAAIKKVEPNMITGQAIIKHGDLNAIMKLGGDSVPSPFAYRLIGKDMYEPLIQTLVDEGRDAAVDAADMFWRDRYGGLEILADQTGREIFADGE